MTNQHLPTVLENIVAGRRRRLPEIRERVAHVKFSDLAPSTRSLYDSLSAGPNRFIMECKSASPSLGMIREHYEPGTIATVYSRYASAISVLCEPDRFNGDYDHLATVASSTHVPVLCKDFIIDPVQIKAARYYGADAILLMMSVLSDEEYKELSECAAELGLDVLTESITEEEIARATRLGAKIFGINHRDLHTLEIDLSRSRRLAPFIPEGAVVVSESGILDHRTVVDKSPYSNAFLVGSRLTSQPDIDLAARELVYGPNKVCGLTSPTAAQVAQAAGAVYGGLIFEEGTPRNVSRETAENIMAHAPGLRYVAVSRRRSGYGDIILPGVSAVQVQAPLGTLEQEHELLSRVRQEIGPEVELWRALPMSNPEAVEIASGVAKEVDRLVLDAGHGGSGKSFDWSRIPENLKDKALLAGGINLENLNHALDVGCAGVDLNSGVEYGTTNGQWHYLKDAGAIRRVFQRIRNYTGRTNTDKMTGTSGMTTPAGTAPAVTTPAGTTPAG